MALNKTQIETALRALAARPYVFGVEADFRYDFAKEIETLFSPDRVCFDYEYPSTFYDVDVTRKSYDLVILEGNEKTAIELKYKTAAVSVTTPSVYRDNSVDILVKRNGNYNRGRYDFVEAIDRLERIVPQKSIILSKQQNYYVVDSDTKARYAVFLTNDEKYWDIKQNMKNIKTAEDREFRVYETKQFVPGNYNWKDGNGNTVHEPGRPQIALIGNYTIGWNDFVDITATGATYTKPIFKYTIVEVL